MQKPVARCVEIGRASSVRGAFIFALYANNSLYDTIVYDLLIVENARILGSL